jgi:hypothetical protein
MCVRLDRLNLGIDRKHERVGDEVSGISRRNVEALPADSKHGRRFHGWIFREEQPDRRTNSLHLIDGGPAHDESVPRR